MRTPLAIIRGANDVASAVALSLFRAGFTVLMLEAPAPAVSRRGQSFADALFDGTATLDGVTARHVGDPAAWRAEGQQEIVLCSAPFPDCLTNMDSTLLVDARMRKRATPENQRGLVPLTIGLGPNFIAGGNVDIAIETAWGEALGRVIESGPTSSLAGEPKPIGGYGRERYIYAPAAGLFRTDRAIGDAVAEGQIVGHLDDAPVLAPKAGILRGLVRDGVAVAERTKLVEVVPEGARVFGLSERPSRIARGVVEAVARYGPFSAQRPSRPAVP